MVKKQNKIKKIKKTKFNKNKRKTTKKNVILNKMNKNKKQKKCPSCGSTEVIHICYGKLTYEGFLKAKRGEIIHGGCIIYPNCPRKGCKNCKKRW